MSNGDNGKVVYPELSYRVVGICYEAHNELGRFAREKQYADLLEKRFVENGVNYQREYAINDSGNIVDFLVEGKIILELKAVRMLGRGEFRQIQNYLQQSTIELGLLVNFNEKYLRPRRVLRVDS